MIRNYFLIFLAIHYAIGQKSFTVVVDTTGSMKEEIEIFQNNVRSMMQATASGPFYNFILIPFFHLDPGPTLNSKSPEGLIDKINAIVVSEPSYDCRENSLSAIKKALEVSKPRSLIFVFTDAEARDNEKLYAIQSLCEQRQSQVVIFQSGSCLNDPWLSTENIYRNIVTSCRGSYFYFYLNELKMAFKYMLEIAKVDWSQITSHKEFNGNQEYSFTIDAFTKDVLVAISGISPQIEIKNDFGYNIRIDEIISTSYMKVVRISEVRIGEYKADISCQGDALVTVYRKKEFNFKYGFSPLQPKSLRETTLLPIPGIMNCLLIFLPDNNLQLISIHLRILDENDHRIVEHRVVDEYKSLYAATILIERETTFQIWINCRDVNNNEVTSTPKLMEPQRLISPSQRMPPQPEILESNTLIDFGTSYSLACKVKSYPKPDIWWENSKQERMHSESALLEIPYVYISYVKIENVTKNETITCKCKNTEGEDEIEAYIYVNRTFTFEVVQYPSDVTFEYGSEGKLFCEANAYPEAEIIWYHNDTVIENSQNFEIIPDEGMLLINKMNLDTTGLYKCKISNTVESRTFSVEVSISGLEAPQVYLQNSDILLQPGDQTEQQCSITKGTPYPEIYWKYKSSYDNNELNDLPDGVTTNGETLKIDSADLFHRGIYVCVAVNIVGIDQKEVSVKIQYPPKIRNDNETKIVILGETVELLCDVDALPDANVLWDFSIDDVNVPFDERHSTDERYTHRFIANKKDSGLYRCNAQNKVGIATRTVNISVQVAPYIEPLAWRTLTAGRGSTIILSCNVILGNPAPSSRWVFIGPKLDTTELLRGHSLGKLDLVLKNITRKQEGSYQCISENDFASDSVRISLKVL